MTLFKKSLLFVFILPLFFGCTITNEFGPYYGKVIDAETEEPIDGAAVLIAFYTESPGPAGSSSNFVDAVETLTNKYGEFNIPSYRITSFRLLQLWEKNVHVNIFKPGYGCFPKNRNAIVTPAQVPDWTLPEDQPVTVDLPRLKTREDRLENYGCYPSEIVPETKYLKLFRLIQSERSTLGLEPRKDPS